MTSSFYSDGGGASSGPGDWVHLAGVMFPCVLGLLPWEARESQRLRLDLHLNLDLSGAAGGDLSRSVDYGTLLEQVQFLAQHGRWLLLESLATAVARFVLAPPAPGERRAQVEAAVVRLGKPDVLHGRAEPAVELRRTRAQVTLDRVALAPGVAAEVLQETKQTGAYRLHVEAGATFAPPAELAALVVAGAIDVDGHACAPGEAVARGAATWRGGAAAGASALVVSRPRPLSRPGAR